MSRSLSELRSAPPKGRPERVMTLCLAPDVVGKVQRLQIALEAVEVAQMEAARDAEMAAEVAEETPRRIGQSRQTFEVPPESPEVRALRAEMVEALEEMRQHEGEMTLRANLTDGEWRRWCNEHPASDEDQPGHARDKRVTVGHCSADALIDNLGAFAYLWNGERLTEGDWADLFDGAVSNPDKAEMATTVVGMYEARMDFPRWRIGLSASLKRLNGSVPPKPSGSPTDDSTAGSPDESPEPTTATASESP